MQGQVGDEITYTKIDVRPMTALQDKKLYYGQKVEDEQLLARLEH